MDDFEKARVYDRLVVEDEALIEFAAAHHPHLVVDEEVEEELFPLNRAQRRARRPKR